MIEPNHPLKIAHISYSMAIGGAERALFQLLRAQQAFGHSVKLIVVSQKGVYAQKAEDAGIEVVSLELNALNFIRGIPKLHRLFADFDVVHFHSPQPVLMSMSVLQRKPRYYFTKRGGVPTLTRKRKLVHAVTDFIIKRRFSGISGNTHHACQIAEEKYGLTPGGAIATYNGIDFDLLQPQQGATEIKEQLGIPSSAIVIGTSANLRSLKRTDKLLRAAEKLKGEIYVCIIGDGNHRPALEGLSLELGIADRCFFTGMVENVTDYLQILDIFALLSDSTESFGNSVVEAMGLGIPSIVMADSPGLVEHMQFEHGLIAEHDDHLLELLGELVKDESLREKVGIKSRQVVREKYTYKAAVLAYNTLYQSTELEFV